MTRITAQDFKKLVDLLKKDGQDGAYLTFLEYKTTLVVKTTDRSGKEIMIELSDVDYPFMPRITRTETF
jgi:hypothetical protein